MRITLHTALALLTSLALVSESFGGGKPSTEELEQLVCYEFAQMYELHTPRFQVSLKRGKNGLKRLADQSWDLLTVKPLSKSQPKGLFPILIEARLGDKVVTRSQATLNVSRYDSILVTKYQVARGAALDPSVLKVEWMETTQLYENPAPADFDVTGWQSKRNLKPGAFITRESIERIPEVRRGDVVTITVMKGLVQITTSGSALQDGAAGETIKVRPADSNKILKVTVVGRGEVRMSGGNL